jgi:hypothetical protein
MAVVESHESPTSPPSLLPAPMSFLSDLLRCMSLLLALRDILQRHTILLASERSGHQIAGRIRWLGREPSADVNA